jgi:hypothetical protein
MRRGILTFTFHTSSFHLPPFPSLPLSLSLSSPPSLSLPLKLGLSSLHYIIKFSIISLFAVSLLAKYYKKR